MTTADVSAFFPRRALNRSTNQARRKSPVTNEIPFRTGTHFRPTSFSLSSVGERTTRNAPRRVSSSRDARGGEGVRKLRSSKKRMTRGFGDSHATPRIDTKIRRNVMQKIEIFSFFLNRSLPLTFEWNVIELVTI